MLCQCMQHYNILILEFLPQVYVQNWNTIVKKIQRHWVLLWKQEFNHNSGMSSKYTVSEAKNYFKTWNNTSLFVTSSFHSCPPFRQNLHPSIRKRKMANSQPTARARMTSLPQNQERKERRRGPHLPWQHSSK